MAANQPSIREDTSRLDTVLPNTLVARLERIASFLGMTKRAAILAILDEGSAVYERRMLDANQVRIGEQSSSNGV